MFGEIFLLIQHYLIGFIGNCFVVVGFDCYQRRLFIQVALLHLLVGRYFRYVGKLFPWAMVLFLPGGFAVRWQHEFYSH